MNINKLVSVIIPCYNCASLIEKTLNSLKEQTYTNIELICIDDGSKDNTREILYNYKGNNPELNITIISQENYGVSFSRNYGINISHGEYLAFVDSDDIVNKRFIELLVCAIEKNDTDTAYCRLTRNIKKFNSDILDEKIKMHSQSLAMKNLLYKLSSFGFSCYLYKRNIIFENNIFFDEKTKRFEDREFIWKYLSNCNNASYINACLYFYRVNENSVLHKKIEWTTDSIDAATRVELYLKNKKIRFYHKIKKYLIARVVWGMAKNYSINKRKDLFLRLNNEYNIRKYMVKTIKDKNILVSLSSILCIISPSLFYNLIKKIKK